jgi:hypothetical protein
MLSAAESLLASQEGFCYMEPFCLLGRLEMRGPMGILMAITLKERDRLQDVGVNWHFKVDL